MNAHCLDNCPEDCDEYDHECHSYCNISSNPEKHGVRMVESHWEKNLSWAYNTVILVEELATGNKYFARDAGCSCPVPFGSFKRAQDMTPLKGHEQEYRDAVYRVNHPPSWDD